MNRYAGICRAEVFFTRDLCSEITMHGAVASTSNSFKRSQIGMRGTCEYKHTTSKETRILSGRGGGLFE